MWLPLWAPAAVPLPGAVDAGCVEGSEIGWDEGAVAGRPGWLVTVVGLLRFTDDARGEPGDFTASVGVVVSGVVTPAAAECAVSTGR